MQLSLRVIHVFSGLIANCFYIDVVWGLIIFQIFGTIQNHLFTGRCRAMVSIRAALCDTAMTLTSLQTGWCQRELRCRDDVIGNYASM